MGTRPSYPPNPVPERDYSTYGGELQEDARLFVNYDARFGGEAHLAVQSRADGLSPRGFMLWYVFLKICRSPCTFLA